MKRGSVIIISGPSGVGKGTVIRQLLERHPQFELSVSVTTRAPRQGEVDGREYHFVSRDEFLRQVDNNNFLEWCEVHGNLYGTYRSEVERRIQSGQDIILEIDTQGAQKVRTQIPGAITIFIAPPSPEELLKRLKQRNTENHADLGIRLTQAEKELNLSEAYDQVVVNNDVDATVQDIVNYIHHKKE